MGEQGKEEGERGVVVIFFLCSFADCCIVFVFLVQLFFAQYLVAWCA